MERLNTNFRLDSFFTMIISKWPQSGQCVPCVLIVFESSVYVLLFVLLPLLSDSLSLF